MPEFQPPRRSWTAKFAAAAAGIRRGMRGQPSFRVHVVMAGLVVVAGVVLRVNLIEWSLLTLCIGVVMGAEMFNSALETLARAIDSNENRHLAEGLDIASGAVLLVAAGAAAVGLIVFIPRVVNLFADWPT